MAEFSKSPEKPTPKPGEVIKPGGELASPVSEPEEKSVAQPSASEEPEAEKVIILSKPSKELATRLLRRVGFKERITGISYHMGPGEEPNFQHSLEEAAGFLGVDEVAPEQRYMWAYFFNWNDLKKWVGETLGDKELAEAIGETTKEYDNCTDLHQRYRQRISLVRPIKKLMLQRLEQCKEIVGEETKA